MLLFCLLQCNPSENNTNVTVNLLSSLINQEGHTLTSTGQRVGLAIKITEAILVTVVIYPTKSMSKASFERFHYLSSKTSYVYHF